MAKASKPKEKPINNPHDALFKAMCEDINVAKDVIRQALPVALFEKVDLSSLVLTDKSFVTGQLKNQHSDIIYQARINGDEGYIAFIIEHQLSSDELMAFRKLEYNVQLMRQHLKQGKHKLPVILNICLYHGEKTPYPHSTDLLDCFSDPTLAKQWMFKPFHLIDLTILSDEEIEKQGYAALMEFLLKGARSVQFSKEIQKLVQLLKRLDLHLHLEPVLYYTTWACGDRDNAEDFIEAMAKALPQVEENIMTYGQQLIQKGMQQGMQQGKLQIAQKMILKGLASDAIAEFTGLSLSEIIRIKKESQR